MRFILKILKKKMVFFSWISLFLFLIGDGVCAGVLEEKYIGFDFEKCIEVIGKPVQVNCDVVVGKKRKNIFITRVKSESEFGVVSLVKKFISYYRNGKNKFYIDLFYEVPDGNNTRYFYLELKNNIVVHFYTWNPKG